MNLHELHNNLAPQLVLAPVATAVADNTAQVSAIVDMRGTRGVEFYILTGTLADADATFAVTMTHGDAVNDETTPTTITDSAAVDTESLVGTLAEASFTFAADSTVKRIGYNPSRGNAKRWVRLTITPSNNTGAAPLAVLALKMPLTVPVA